MVEGRTQHLDGLRVPSTADEEFGETQGGRDVARMDPERLPVAGFGIRRPPEHLQHQGAVGQRSGARRTAGAVQHLIEEGKRASRIATHCKRGGGGGANSGGGPLAARFQYPIEEDRRRGRVASPQPGVGQPARRAQGSAFEQPATSRNQRGEEGGGSAGIPGKQIHPRLPDQERRLRRIPGGAGVRHARRLLERATVEQQAQQLHPLVPAGVADGGEQQVATAGPEATFLVAGEQPPPLGGASGIRILGQQLPEPEAHRRVVRRLGDRPPEPADGFFASAEQAEETAHFVDHTAGRLGRPHRSLEERQRPRVVVLGEAQPPAFQVQSRRIVGSGGTQQLPGFVSKAGLAELGREFQPQRLGERDVESQQLAQDFERRAIPAEHGEQPDMQDQRRGVPGTCLQRPDRGRIIEQPDVRLGAQALQRRVLSRRPGGIEDFKNRREVLFLKQPARFGEQRRVPLGGAGCCPEQQRQGERRHGR